MTWGRSYSVRAGGVGSWAAGVRVTAGTSSRATTVPSSTPSAAEGRLSDVLWDGPAYKVGLTIGTQIIAVNGTAYDADQIKNAFRILLSDHAVKAVLINIFGGILRCDTLATGVVAAAHELSIKVPIVVRMEGTNVELGRKILLESGFNFTVADGMRDAAQKVVALAQ